MAVLFLIVFSSLFISFTCSILEAALLSVSLAGLSRKKEAGSKGAARLLHLKLYNIHDAISAILTLNTIAHTVGAALAGATAATLWGDRWVGLFSGVLTLLILLLSEIIPKTLGTVYDLKLSGLVGHITFWLTKLMKPLVVMTRYLTKFVTRHDDPGVTSGDISALVALAVSHGEITKEQSKVLSNLLYDDHLTVADVMTPRSVITMIPADATVGELLKAEDTNAFSRVPVFGENFDDVKGYVLVREVCTHAACKGNLDKKLQEFMRTIHFLPKSYPVGEALRALIRKKEHMAVVLDEYGGISGLVTLEDLFETILGIEIIDESDRVVDLRKVAMNIRDQRLERQSKKRERPLSEN